MNYSGITSKNTWKIRNDSSNISTILAPNDKYQKKQSNSLTCYQKKQIKKPIIYTITTCNQNNLITRHTKATHCNTCYCTQKPQLPLLNLGQQFDENHLQRQIKSARARDHCYYYLVDADKDSNDNCGSVRSEKLLKEVHSKVNYDPTTIFLKRLKEEAQRKNMCNESGFTKQRNEYEELTRLCKENQKQRATFVNSIDDDIKIANSPRLRAGNDCCTCPKYESQLSLIENPKNISTVKDFRDRNYFETHSSSCDLQDIGSHKCIHRFHLDDNRNMNPDNSDSYGISRCIICNKPMMEEDLSKKIVDSRLKGKNSKEIMTAKKKLKGLISLEPRKLYVPMRNEKVELNKVPDDVCLEMNNAFIQFRKFIRCVPISSVALRYQKGVV